TVVATVGLAVLGTRPDQETDLSAATAERHDDLRPKAVAFGGTAAAGFGDAQRVADHVRASPTAPLLGCAVVGFSGRRPARCRPGRDALDRSGAQGTANALGDMPDARIEDALAGLWAHRP